MIKSFTGWLYIYIYIERKTDPKFLGVIVDEKLAWTKHIKTLNSKMSRYTGIM
jgi:hypothetical protein